MVKEGMDAKPVQTRVSDCSKDDNKWKLASHHAKDSKALNRNYSPKCDITINVFKLLAMLPLGCKYLHD